MIARVAVSTVTFSIDKGYDYEIPEKWQGIVCPGIRVVVPFGIANRQVEAIILKIVDENKNFRYKRISEVLDLKPLLNDKELRLARFIRTRCFCTFYDAIKCMLPKAFWFKHEKVWHICEDKGNVSESENEIANLYDFIEKKKEVSEKEIKQVFLNIDVEKYLGILKDRKLADFNLQMIRKLKGKINYYYSISPNEGLINEFLSDKRHGKKQRELIDFVNGHTYITIEEIRENMGDIGSCLNGLVKAGIITAIPEDKMDLDRQIFDRDISIALNVKQNEVFQGILKLINNEKPECALLQGVTGSGKTLVYLKLIHEVLKKDKTAIVLVPEIGLTPQVRIMFQQHFGSSVAVVHSGLSDGERYNTWKNIRNGKIKVVIGTRSAIFAPLDNLGLIVIDEEQEHTYKSENSPCYDARDIAKFKCSVDNALLLMCSATPSVETRYQAEQGTYKYFRLNERFNKKALPDVYIADSRLDLKNGNVKTIGSKLYSEIAENIQNKKKTIIFINRRGTSRSLQCVECGFVQECINCSSTMTYHSNVNQLICHHCGYTISAPKTCPECGGALRRVGAGTQQVIEDLKELFPNTEVLRMDADSTSQKDAHENILYQFQHEDIPILVGTQMITKGLNIEDVTLVGILNADLSLYVNDYRSSERTFSLITQVIGRAGRGVNAGRAVLQTYAPENPVLRCAAKQDYDEFYNNEIQLREAADIPPFTDYFEFSVYGESEENVIECCMRLRMTIQQEIDKNEKFQNIRVLGPAPNSITRVNRIYQYHVTISAPANASVRDLAARLMMAFREDPRNKRVTLSVNQNPEN